MSGPGVGFQFPPKPVSWLQRDLLLFANSIGCTPEELHYLYELHPNFTAFPTYPIILPFKGASPEVNDFLASQKATPIPGIPELNGSRAVDGERKITFLKPLPTSSEGRQFEIRATVLGVYDKGRPGTVVEVQQDLVDTANNDVYTRVVGSAFYIGQGGWHGPKGPATKGYPPPKDKSPDVTCEHQTSAGSAALYRLNGDYNPLHIDAEPGKKMGFGGVILHGLYSWNSTCHELLKALGGNDPANIKEYQARFASPVRPGDKLVTRAWRTGERDGDWEEVRFQTQIEGGKVCLSNGRALMRCVGAEAKNKL